MDNNDKLKLFNAILVLNEVIVKEHSSIQQQEINKLKFEKELNNQYTSQQYPCFKKKWYSDDKDADVVD